MCMYVSRCLRAVAAMTSGDTRAATGRHARLPTGRESGTSTVTGLRGSRRLSCSTEHSPHAQLQLCSLCMHDVSL